MVSWTLKKTTNETNRFLSMSPLTNLADTLKIASFVLLLKFSTIEEKILIVFLVQWIFNKKIVFTTWTKFRTRRKQTIFHDMSAFWVRNWSMVAVSSTRRSREGSILVEHMGHVSSLFKYLWRKIKFLYFERKRMFVIVLTEETLEEWPENDKLDRDRDLDERCELPIWKEVCFCLNVCLLIVFSYRDNAIRQSLLTTWTQQLIIRNPLMTMRTCWIFNISFSCVRFPDEENSICRDYFHATQWNQYFLTEWETLSFSCTFDRSDHDIQASSRSWRCPAQLCEIRLSDIRRQLTSEFERYLKNRNKNDPIVHWCRLQRTGRKFADVLWNSNQKPRCPVLNMRKENPRRVRWNKWLNDLFITWLFSRTWVLTKV